MAKFKLKSIAEPEPVPVVPSAAVLSKALYKKELLRLTKKIERLEKSIADHDELLKRKHESLESLQKELYDLKAVEISFT